MLDKVVQGLQGGAGLCRVVQSCAGLTVLCRVDRVVPVVQCFSGLCRIVQGCAGLTRLCRVDKVEQG